MKNRINNQVRQMRQLFKYFKQTKNKCQRMIQTMNAYDYNLQKFKQIQQLFIIDLTLLTLDHLTTRKNKLMLAIDQIMKIQSSLNLKKMKERNKNQQQQNFKRKQLISPGYLSPRKAEQSIFSLNSIADKKQLSDQNSIMNKSRLKVPYSKAAYEYDDSDPENQSYVNSKYMFDHFSLLNIWNKNRGSLEETSDDKLDRLSKIIGALKKNIKILTNNEKVVNKQIKINGHPQYCKVLQQLERYKMKSEQLEIYLGRLKQQNQTLKKQIMILKKSPGLKMQTMKKQLPSPILNEKVQNILYKGSNFQIIKIKTQKSKKHKSLQIKNSTLEQPLKYQNLLKYIFTLQQNIVDKLNVASTQILKKNQALNQFKKQIIIPKKQQIKKSSKFLNQRKIEVPFLETAQMPSQNVIKQSIQQQYLSPRNQIVMNTIEKVNLNEKVSLNDQASLNEMGQKLSEIRKQRKKMFEDDDLWKQVQKLKL